jgi:predicted N-acetyltransferase YhbS
MTPPATPVPDVVLSDGAVVRGALQADVPAMSAIEADRESPDDALDLELVAGTPGGVDSMSVVEFEGQVVSIATLLDETVQVQGLSLPTGQIEMVATARAAEGRGYVRALMNRSHQLSSARGHVLQVMIGIPNFYRQFGYAYSIPMHPWATVAPGRGEDAGSLSVAVATPDDLVDLRRLQTIAQRPFEVSMPHSDDCWHWLLSHASSQQLLVRDAPGTALAVARVYDDGEGSIDVGEVASESDAATEVLLGHVMEAAGPDGSVRVNVRPHVPGLASRTTDLERRDWYYTRIAHPAALLTALAPVLLTRLRDAGREHGEALISFFGSHVRLTWSNDRLTVTPGGALQAPVSQGGSGVPLDALGSLLFGGGAASLEDWFPDAHMGRQVEVMDILFPAVAADLLTFYLPS